MKMIVTPSTLSPNVTLDHPERVDLVQFTCEPLMQSLSPLTHAALDEPGAPLTVNLSLNIGCRFLYLTMDPEMAREVRDRLDRILGNIVETEKKSFETRVR